jgi:hypothetical protein
MTAINIHVSNNGQLAHIVSDGAIYHRRGKHSRGTASKLIIVPQARTVVAFSGTLPVLKSLTQYCDGCTAFDEMVDRFPDIWRRSYFIRVFQLYLSVRRSLFRVILRRDMGGSPLDFAIFFVGYSEANGRVKVVCANGDGGNPPEMSTNDTFIFPGIISMEETEQLFPRSTRAATDASVWGDALLAIMKKQRDIANEQAGGVVIGQHAIYTTISFSAISSRLLHRW